MRRDIFVTMTNHDSRVCAGGEGGEVRAKIGSCVECVVVTSRRASTSDRTDATDRLERWRKFLISNAHRRDE